MYLRTQKLHTINIECLADRILLSHIDLTFQPQKCCCSCSRNTVLSGTGLCNNPCLAHLLCKKRLPQNIVDLMGTGVIQIFSLEIDLGSSQILRHLLRIIKQRRASRILF